MYADDDMDKAQQRRLPDMAKQVREAMDAPVGEQQRMVPIPRDEPAWPTEEMITAAELKMPQLGRIQIRFLFETMIAARPTTAIDGDHIEKLAAGLLADAKLDDAMLSLLDYRHGNQKHFTTDHAAQIYGALVSLAKRIVILEADCRNG